MTTYQFDVTFDPIAERWTFARTDRSELPPLVEVHPGGFVGRAADGTFLEVVLDAVAGRTPSRQSLDLLAMAMGGPARDEFLRQLQSDQFRLTAAAPGVVALAQRVANNSLIVDEPGVPQRQADGSYVVPGANGAVHLVAGNTSISVVVTREAADGATWVVISDGATGTLLASGRLRDIGDGRLAADVTFGLPLPPEDLLVATGHDPLEPVAPRDVRRAAWARSLLAEARTLVRRRPIRARRRATKAAEIAMQLADDTLLHDATATAQRARRWAYGLAAVVIAALGGGVGFGLATWVHDDPGSPAPTDTSIYFQNCDAARAAGPTPILKGQPGYRPGLDRDGDGAACEG